MRKSNDIHESKKIGMQIEKLNITLINNVKQTLNQVSGVVNQQFKQQEIVKQELNMIQTLIDQLEAKSINSIQAKDNAVILLEKQQNITFDSLFINQLNQVIAFYTSSQLIQTAITLQENIENIFKQTKQKTQTYYQSQPVSELKKSQTQIQEQKSGQWQKQQSNIDNEQFLAKSKTIEVPRSQTPTYTKSPSTTQRQHSIEQKQATSTIYTDRSITPMQKSYEFKSGMLFKDQLSKTQKDQQQDQIRQQQNTSSSLISRSTIFPKIVKQFVVKAHDKRISSIQVAQHCVFTSSYDKLIRAWDKNTGQPISTMEGHTREITHLKFKHDTLASCGADKTIRIWKHHPRWQLIGNLKGHQSLITSLEFLNAKQLLSGSEDQSLKVWDLEKQLEIHSIKFEFPIYCLTIENDKLYVGGDGAIMIYQCPQLQQIRYQHLHESPISMILLTNVYLITIDREGIIKLSDKQSYQFIKELKDDYEISSAVYIQQYNFLVVGLSTTSGEGKICFWSLDTSRKIKEIYDNGSGVGGLIYEGSYLWSGHDNKRLECLKFG